MRQGGPNGRRPRGRHHGGGGGGGHHGGGHSSHGGPSGGNGGNSRMPDPMNAGRPRSAASLRHQTFDSHCLDVRVRGNAWQVCEKYQQLARDMAGSGDRVAAENYLQHAEHYFRIIEAINEATAVEQRQRGGAPPSPFGQQPEMPSNYFGPDGNLAAPPAGNAADGGNPMTPVAGAPAAQAQQAQAEVIQRAAPQQQNPFFGNEEGEEQGVSTEPLAVRR